MRRIASVMRIGWAASAMAAFLMTNMTALPAAAQDAAAKPGQEQQPTNEGQATGPLAIGQIHWYPVDAACTFFTADGHAAFAENQPDTWQFVFITMRETRGAKGDAQPLEHGYVMTNGLLRELEKVKSAPDGEGNTVTVWRSAGEPRINVNMKLIDDGKSGNVVNFKGQMTLFWGDKKEVLDVLGRCQN
ncbi:hypothetical protein [Consotaella salsifontis]|uniref:Uncharacterized protein n=1 Tax=Consotaella salsifontis TaxID=1365950 RepID=A0A1T4RXZ7_9HYPH|nr:hypothetical protein [Consotaella salsifontis]SKA20618.1 hypothetical protein SAMN05428963_10856 [Consotaella salsifontis]